MFNKLQSDPSLAKLGKKLCNEKKCLGTTYIKMTTYSSGSNNRIGWNKRVGRNFLFGENPM